MNTEIHIVQTTLPGSWIEAEVGEFAHSMLESGAGCVQHSLIHSTYKWDGATQSSPEWKLQLKVSEPNIKTVLISLEEKHPYTTPQIIHWRANTSQNFADWLNIR